MNGKKKNEFLELYSKLPMPIQDFLASDKMGIIIEDALNLSKVPPEKFSGIMDIATEVLSFQLSKGQFKNELEKRINIPPVAAQIVDKVIQEKIFRMFEKELNQYKSQPLEQKVPQEMKIKEPIKPLESPGIKPAIKEKVEPIIPEYSFPEPSKVVVEKPVSKMEELKRVVTPKVSSEQQEKIREKLLVAMQKKNDQPKIVEEMKKIFLKPKGPKQTEGKEKKIPGRIKIGELTSSEILSGEGKKFKDEEVFKKTKKEKPYILGAKLKEEKEKKERPDISKEPIPYKKYQKKNPFGEA